MSALRDTRAKWKPAGRDRVRVALMELDTPGRVTPGWWS